MVDQKKRWFYTINPHFFWLEKSGWPEKKIRVWRTTFLEPLFYTFLENRLQNKWSSFWSKRQGSLDHLFCNHISRKVVLEKWFCKLGFFFWSTTFLQPEKMWIYGIKPPFFLVNHLSRTIFLQPDFSNQISRTTILHFSRKVVAE